MSIDKDAQNNYKNSKQAQQKDHKGRQNNYKGMQNLCSAFRDPLSHSSTLTHKRMIKLENQTSLSPWRWQRDPGCHLETWAPRSKEVWTQPGWTPNWWPRLRPISGWRRSSDTHKKTRLFCKLLCSGVNTTAGGRNDRTKVLLGPIICLMRRHLPLSSSRSAPTFTLNLVQPFLSASVQSCGNTQLYAKFIWMWLLQPDKSRVLKGDLFELQVWVSEPCTGGGVGRITLFQHLILWQANKAVHTGNKHSGKSVS